MVHKAQRGNREPRKPKKEKPKPPAQTPSFSRPLGTATTKTAAGKKAR